VAEMRDDQIKAASLSNVARYESMLTLIFTGLPVSRDVIVSMLTLRERSTTGLRAHPSNRWNHTQNRTFASTDLRAHVLPQISENSRFRLKKCCFFTKIINIKSLYDSILLGVKAVFCSFQLHVSSSVDPILPGDERKS
ncbi:MAG: hypothetical protein ACRDAM_18560, partial [Casimicrobium sp.]